jgi:hypothetical protein
MGDKFVTQIQLGRQTCCPSGAKKGLKDWANINLLEDKLPPIIGRFCFQRAQILMSLVSESADMSPLSDRRTGQTMFLYIVFNIYSENRPNASSVVV